MQEIFAPFLSTKPVNKGTGLESSISYQIVVENYGDRFRCENMLQGGTEFMIELPITQIEKKNNPQILAWIKCYEEQRFYL